jgi:hypothetical protein
MARGGSVRICRTAVVCAGFYLSHPAIAADLPGARLEVTRGPGAASCPDAQVLADTLRELLGPGRVLEAATVVLEVEVRSTRTGFAATVHASGAKRGVRTLSADGPSCEGLSEALVVSLLVLLDRDPERPASTRQAPRPARGTELSLWAAFGGALTRDLPDGYSGALIGEAGARYGPHAVWLGGVFTPESEFGFRMGTVALNANGVQLRACTQLFGEDSLRADGCAVGLLLALQGAADGYNKDNDSKVRPWWLAGGGAELAFLPAPWLATSLSGRVLFAPKKEVFSIEGLGDAYETQYVALWLGLSLSAKIW